MAGYLGNKSNSIVHHLETITSECKIVEIKKLDKTYFIPDTLEQAIAEKFKHCNYCIKTKKKY